MLHHDIPTIVLEIAYVGRGRERREITARRTIIGRESGDIVLGDPEASALHAEIDCGDGHVIVRDLGSFNGTLREGKRLPQFALFPGQTFRCGQTDITLVEVRGGAAVPAPGRTAVSTTAPRGSTSTLPAHEPPSRPETLVRSSGASASPSPASTLVGVPPPGGQPARAPIYAGPTLPGDAVAPAPSPAEASTAHSHDEPVFRPPVANAVIKPSREAGVGGGPPSSTATRRRSLGTIFAWVGIAAACLGAIVGLVFFVQTLLAGRQLAFVETIAADLPGDTVGVVALRSPRAVLEIVGDETGDELRRRIREPLGLDLFEQDTWASAGVSLDAPIGLALLHAEDGVLALSFGVTDADAARATILERLRAQTGDPDLRWVEREIGSVTVEWLEEPTPLAAVHRGKRLVLVWSERSDRADAVTRAVERIAEVSKGQRLADRPGFEALVPPDGETLVLAYLDGASARASISGTGLEQIAVRTALADIDGFALGLSRDGSAMHVTAQTVLREGATALALAGERRITKSHALRRVDAPVLASLDLAFDPSAFEQTLSSLSVLGGFGLRVVEDQVREEFGVDLRSDLLRNLTGELGYALLQLPSTSRSDDVRALAWVGVSDERKTAEVLDKALAKLGEPTGARTESVGGTTVHLFDGPPRIAAFVFAGHLWVAVGEIDLRDLFGGTSASFLDAPRHPSIAEALRSGGSMAGFVDVRELLAASEPLLGSQLRVSTPELAAVVEPIEVVTVRAWTKARTMVSRFSVHTSTDDALQTLVRAAVSGVGSTLVGLPELPTEKPEPEPPELEPMPVPYVDDIWPKTRHEHGSVPARDVSYAVELGRDPQARGPADALVTIVQFGDFECPYSRQVTTTLDEVLAEHGREVRLVFRHNPLPGHPHARTAARAAIAAGRQGQLWPMHDKLFEHPTALGEADVRRWAVELGLDPTRFDRDFYDAATERQIDDDIEAARQLAATGTPAFFVNGRYLPGAQPAAAFAALIAEERARAETFVARRGNTRKHLYRDMITHFAPGVPPPAPPTPTPEDELRHPVSAEGLPRRGATAFARVEIIACMDFDCPFCARVQPTVETILERYPTEVSYAVAHNPLAFHPGAEPAARAAIAAARQDKFWEMHDELFAKQKLRTEADLESMARALRLDIPRWKRDMSDARTTELIEANKRLCNDNDARGTPSFFINGRLLSGAQPFSSFEAIIEDELRGAAGI